MIETTQNGTAPVAEPPAPEAVPGAIPGLPPGTITVTPQTHQTLMRLLQQHQPIADVLRAFLDAKEAKEQYSLAVPVFLLVPQREGQGG